MNKKIILTKRSEDFMAHIEGHSEIWDCGPSPDAAIGSLIRSHREVFGIDVWWEVDDVQTKMFLNDPDAVHKAY
ncbi:MAG TPA: hypothetical protein VJH05_00720 [Candidatus Paceibacterota bacterium]